MPKRDCAKREEKWSDRTAIASFSSRLPRKWHSNHHGVEKLEASHERNVVSRTTASTYSERQASAAGTLSNFKLIPAIRLFPSKPSRSARIESEGSFARHSCGVKLDMLARGQSSLGRIAPAMFHRSQPSLLLNKSMCEPCLRELRGAVTGIQHGLFSAQCRAMAALLKQDKEKPIAPRPTFMRIETSPSEAITVDPAAKGGFGQAPGATPL